MNTHDRLSHSTWPAALMLGALGACSPQIGEFNDEELDVDNQEIDASPVSPAQQSGSSGCDSVPNGLYGLCNAYCNAMDCDSPDHHASDQACTKVLDNYHDHSGGEDPPCDGGAPACGWTIQAGTNQRDEYRAAVQASDGSIYAVGFTGGDMAGTGNDGGFDAFITKLDSSGNEQWIRQFGSGGNDFAIDVVVDEQGDVYVAGHSNFDLDGDASPVAPTCGSGAYVGDCPDVFLAKYDASGNQLWLEQWGTSRRESALQLMLDPLAGDIVMMVYSSNAAYGASRSPQLVRWDTTTGAATPLWMYSTFWNNNPSRMAIAADGNIYVTGRAQVSIGGALSTQGAAGGGWYLFKVSAAGATQWVTHAGSSGHDIATDVVVDDAGDVYVVGFVQGVASGTPPGTSYQGADGAGWSAWGDVAIAKFSSAGAQQWAAQTGTSRDDAAFGVSIAAEGSLRVASSSRGDLATGAGLNLGDKDLFMTDLGADGNWGTTVSIGSPQDDRPFHIETSAGLSLIAARTLGDLDGEGSGPYGDYDAVLINLCE